ncbi:MAG: HNH endonuclease [Desulfovibrionaceae bacterium]|nr:HNH endonuclease [Desulfovibrionaceae bacterium]
MPNLEFRKIPSLNFLYEVREDGRVVRNVKSKHQLSIKLDMHHSKKGYYVFWTCIALNGERKVRRHMVHAIVAECWLGKKTEGLEIDHIDRNTHNNHYSNLRYCTHSQQMQNRKLGDHVIEQAIKNCQQWNAQISIQVRLMTNGEVVLLPSLMAAARYLSKQYGCTIEHARCKLKSRRAHIFDYDVSYLNAETVR